MKIRKIVATIVITAMFFWAPAIIPARATNVFIGCGTPVTLWEKLLPIDTAFAGVIVTPCPPAAHGAFPWPVLIFGLGVTSVIVNSIYVGHTQCRELSYQEAWMSALLPFIGIAFNQLNDQCHPLPHHHH